MNAVPAGHCLVQTRIQWTLEPSKHPRRAFAAKGGWKLSRRIISFGRRQRELHTGNEHFVIVVETCLHTHTHTFTAVTRLLIISLRRLLLSRRRARTKKFNSVGTVCRTIDHGRAQRDASRRCRGA